MSEGPKVVELCRSIKVITLSTDESDALANWRYGARKLGYDVTVLGVGEKWGGWAWRTSKYIEAVEKLPRGTFVLIIDGNDILFVRGPASLLRAFRSIDRPLVFGGEATCCVGKFAATQMNGERGRAMATINSREPLNRWKFPNAGCIMGRRDTVLAALMAVKDEPDDQAGHLGRYLDDPNCLSLDWKHAIVGNVNRPSPMYCVDCSAIADNMNAFELQFWERVTVKDLIAEGRETADALKDTVGPVLYRNKETGGLPCVLHFPGGNMQAYNTFGASVYGSSFRPIREGAPPSVGKSALLGIADLWRRT
jgi:hypothetical protein